MTAFEMNWAMLSVTSLANYERTIISKTQTVRACQQPYKNAHTPKQGRLRTGITVPNWEVSLTIGA